MKNNNKNRKLKTIRDRNKFRQFKSSKAFLFKISNEIKIDSDYDSFIDNYIKTEIDQLQKRYNFKCEVLDVFIGSTAEDYLQDICTLKIKVGRYKY